VDQLETLGGILNAVAELSSDLPIVFPCHVRTRARIEQHGLIDRVAARQVQVLEPLGYLAFLSLMSRAALVLTDSGGIQEETTILGVPCLTLRENTERPVTVEQGTNVLVGTSAERILVEARKVLGGDQRRAQAPELWDGRAAERIVGVLQKTLFARPESFVATGASAG
jgi:UDP-N-acetylglucosamine 2-epimerase (non-hydrolysing)